jgi:hypothetical protein
LLVDFLTGVGAGPGAAALPHLRFQLDGLAIDHELAKAVMADGQDL